MLHAIAKELYSSALGSYLVYGSIAWRRQAHQIYRWHKAEKKTIYLISQSWKVGARVKSNKMEPVGIYDVSRSYENNCTSKNQEDDA